MSAPSSEARSRDRRIDRCVLAALVAASAALLYSLRPYGLLISDEGFMVYPAARMLEGDLLYRDVYPYYAPLGYHLLELVFRITGPSLIAARTLWMLFLLVSVAGIYRIARRFVPPAAAWLPAATYALAPGPWHKAFYGLCVVSFLLALVRSVEHKSASRHLQLGAVCGAVLMFRQELGAAQLLLGAGLVGIVPLWPLRPASFRGGAFLLGLRRVSLVVSGFVAAVIPVFALYAVQGNLVDLRLLLP